MTVRVIVVHWRLLIHDGAATLYLEWRSLQEEGPTHDNINENLFKNKQKIFILFVVFCCTHIKKLTSPSVQGCQS